MTKEPSPPERPSVRRAKGAARETIGKLIGDDSEVSEGRREQKAADRSAAAQIDKQQE